MIMIIRSQLHKENKAFLLFLRYSNDISNKRNDLFDVNQ